MLLGFVTKIMLSITNLPPVLLNRRKNRPQEISLWAKAIRPVLTDSLCILASVTDWLAGLSYFYIVDYGPISCQFLSPNNFDSP